MKIKLQTGSTIDIEKNEDEANQNKPIKSMEAVKKLAQTESKTPTQFKFVRGFYITMEIVFLTLLVVHGVGMTETLTSSVLFLSSQHLHNDRQVRIDRNDSTSNNIICDTVLALQLENNEPDQNKNENSYTRLTRPLDFFTYFLVFVGNLALIMVAAIRVTALIGQNKEESYSKIDDDGDKSSDPPFRKWFVFSCICMMIELFVVYIGIQLKREAGMELHFDDFVFINDIFGIYFWFIIANLFFINEALRKFVEVRCNN